MKTKTEQSAPKERTVAFASVILAFSLFGFLWPFHDTATDKRSTAGLKVPDSQNNSLPKDSHPGWGPVSF
jgi:hypothetical protein